MILVPFLNLNIDFISKKERLYGPPIFNKEGEGRTYDI